MKYIKQFIHIICSIFTFVVITLAQSPSQIKLKCPSPNATRYASISIKAVGDMVYLPCPNRSSIFDGIVDFSGATVTGLPFTVSPLTTKGDLWGFSTINARIPIGTNGQVLTADSTQTLGLKWATPTSSGVTGTGTTNFIPRWTNGAGGVIGNTPFSWSGSQYVFNNTALNSNFRIEFTPIAGNSIFNAKDFVTGEGLSYSQTTGRMDFNSFGVAPVNMRIDNGAGEFHLNLANGVQNSWDFISGLSTIHSSNLVNIIGGGGINVNSGAAITVIGDVNGAGNNTQLTIDDTTGITTASGGLNINGQSNLFGGVSIVGQIDIDISSRVNGNFVPLTSGAFNIGSSSRPFGSWYIGTTNTHWTNLTSNATSSQSVTLPDASGTIQLVGAANTGTVMSVPLANSVLANATGTIFTSPCTTLLLATTTEGNVSCPVTRSGTVRNLYVRTGGTAKVNSPTTTITMRKNGSNQTVTLTLTETVNTTSSDTTHSFTVTAGDLITISMSVAGAAAVSTSISGMTFEID